MNISQTKRLWLEYRAIDAGRIIADMGSDAAIVDPTSRSKPTGVDLLITLSVIGGIIDILAVALLLVVTSVSLPWWGSLVGVGVIRLVFLIVSVISFFLIFCGGSSFLQAYGLWKGRGWAWTWARGSSMVGLAASIIALGVGIGIVGVASNALTLYYLNRTEVKAYFGKAQLPESYNFPRLSMVERFCAHCGIRFNGKEEYCPSCGSKRQLA